MSNHDETKPKGTIVTGLNEKIRTYDGNTIEQDKVTMLGIPVFQKDENGKITGREAEELTFRKAILLALATDLPGEEKNEMAKLGAGHFARIFWNENEIALDSEDVQFLKARLNNKWGGIVYTLMCEFLEAVPPLAEDVVQNALEQIPATQNVPGEDGDSEKPEEEPDKRLRHLK